MTNERIAAIAAMDVYTAVEFVSGSEIVELAQAVQNNTVQPWDGQHDAPATLRPYAGTLAEILNAVRIAAQEHVICGAVHGPHVCTKEPHRGDGFAHECVAPESITNSAIVYARWPQ